MVDVKLTEKQKRFVDEYLIDLNATKAAIRAGYSKKTANRIGTENLSKLVVREHISTRMKDREKRTEITQDMVLQELAKIAFDDIKNYLSYKTEKTVVGTDELGKPIIDYKIVIDLKDSNTIDSRNISEVSQGKNGQFKFKLYCKDTALVSIGKHLGMFTDKVDIGNKDGETFKTELTPDELKLLERVARRVGEI